MKKFLLLSMMLVVSACNLRQPIAVPDLSTFLPQSSETPAETPTPPPSPTPRPTPTPVPEVRIHTGEETLLNGDFDRAREEFRIALDGALDEETRAAALWGSARVEYQDGNF